MRLSVPLFIAILIVGRQCAVSQKFQPKTIQFKGAPEYSTAELLTTAQLKQGDILDYGAMNDHLKKLMDTGMFATVGFKFDGVDLVFAITPSDSLLKTQFDNVPLDNQSVIAPGLHNLLPLYHGQVPNEGGYAESVRTALAQILASHGLQSSVVATPTGDPGHRGPATVMSYTINSPHVLVGPITIEGASAEFAGKLGEMAAKASQSSFDSTTSADQIEHEFAEFYEDRSYAGAHVTVMRGGEANADESGIHVPYSVRIDEGKRYTIGTIKLPTGALFTQPELDKLAADRPNGPEPGARLHNLWTAIVDRYKSKGYLDVKVIPNPQFDPNSSKVDYNVAIETGPVYHLAFVKFEGVSDQLRALLVHNWQMLPGDPFDETYAANFVSITQQHDPVLRRTLSGVVAHFNATADQQTHDVNVVIQLAKQ